MNGLACRVTTGLSRARSAPVTQRRIPQGRADEDRLVADMIELARQYGRYGRRLDASRRPALEDAYEAGWLVNDKRIERLAGISCGPRERRGSPAMKVPCTTGFRNCLVRKRRPNPSSVQRVFFENAWHHDCGSEQNAFCRSLAAVRTGDRLAPHTRNFECRLVI